MEAYIGLVAANGAASTRNLFQTIRRQSAPCWNRRTIRRGRVRWYRRRCGVGLHVIVYGHGLSISAIIVITVFTTDTGTEKVNVSRKSVPSKIQVVWTSAIRAPWEKIPFGTMTKGAKIEGKEE